MRLEEERGREKVMQAAGIIHRPTDGNQQAAPIANIANNNNNTDQDSSSHHQNQTPANGDGADVEMRYDVNDKRGTSARGRLGSRLSLPQYICVLDGIPCRSKRGHFLSFFSVFLFAENWKSQYEFKIEEKVRKH